MSFKKLVFWLGFGFLNLLVVELAVRAYFFQRKSDYPLALVHYAVNHYWQFRERQAATHGVGIWRDDKVLGYAHIPNSKGTHHGPAFDVTYTIGPEGERVIPSPAASRGRILMLGCSYTFGWGVEDREAYPSLLGTESWRDFQVVNKATSGYGTTHAYLQLRDALEHGPAPALAIYAMIPVHVCRNYLRPSWVEHLAASKRGHPHLEVIDGRPQFIEVIHGSPPALEERELRRREVALTAALLTEMQRSAAEAKVPFVVVLLPQKDGAECGGIDWPPAVIDSLVRNKVPYVDLTERLPDMSWIRNDHHPDPRGHRVIANALALSSIKELLQGFQHEHSRALGVLP